MVAPFAVVKFGRTAVTLDSGEITKSLVVRAPTSSEMHQIYDAIDRDEEAIFAIVYGLAGLDAATVARIDPADRAALDDAIVGLMRASLDHCRH